MSATATRRASGMRRRRFSARRRPLSPTPSTPTPNLRMSISLRKSSRFHCVVTTSMLNIPRHYPHTTRAPASPPRRPEISLPLPALDMSLAGFLNGLRFRDLSDRHVPPRFIARDRIVIVGLHYHERGASLFF